MESWSGRPFRREVKRKRASTLPARTSRLSTTLPSSVRHEVAATDNSLYSTATNCVGGGLFTEYHDDVGSIIINIILTKMAATPSTIYAPDR
jgi:hypothetical protein